MGLNLLVSSGILSANQMIVIDTNGNIRTATIGENCLTGPLLSKEAITSRMMQNSRHNSLMQIILRKTSPMM